LKDGQSPSGSPDGIFWMDINSEVHWRVRLYNAYVGD